MSGTVLFEQRYRGDLWRLEIAQHDGRTFANWRKWYDREGTWKPSRQGCTFPLDRLRDLADTLAEYRDKPAERGT